ncbi:response regulator [Vibrio ishigakensis]|uniref:Response regulator n=1 Tax=Vibrio ishigakensis TaxID=1481914 RepID=A0A0B8QKL4_9VIBR|nr:response regulator [Vibrio ishigakensis]
MLSEIDEYQSIIRRFEELEVKLEPLLEQARERSAQLLGKVNVLNTVINTLSEEVELC